MNATTAAARAMPAPTQPDLGAIKTRQQGAWSSGDYAVVGTTLQIVGETLCEALDLRAGQRVLDVAAGNGNVTLAAARRWCEVVSTDYVSTLLDRGRARANADGARDRISRADAEALPFDDASFDAVVSTFGVMFTADQDKAAAELVRVCKPGGKIGSIQLEQRAFVFRYRAAQHWLDVFKTYYGPLLKTFGALDPKAQLALTEDLFALIKRFNRSGDATMVVPSEYLEVVVTRR